MHELKSLAHELFELRDSHLKEIQQLKEDAKLSELAEQGHGAKLNGDGTAPFGEEMFLYRSVLYK